MRVGQHAPGAKILEIQAELAVAGIVGSVSADVLIVADCRGADPDELVLPGKLIDIQQDFLGRVHAAFAPAKRGVLLSFFRAVVVEVAAVANRNAEIGLLDARQHLLVERIFEGLQIFGERLRIGVFRFEVFHHARIGLLAKPVILIHNRCPVTYLLVFDSRCNGRSGLGEQAGHGDESNEANSG